MVRSVQRNEFFTEILQFKMDYNPYSWWTNLNKAMRITMRKVLLNVVQELLCSLDVKSDSMRRIARIQIGHKKMAEKYNLAYFSITGNGENIIHLQRAKY